MHPSTRHHRYQKVSPILRPTTQCFVERDAAPNNSIDDDEEDNDNDDDDDDDDDDEMLIDNPSDLQRALRLSNNGISSSRLNNNNQVDYDTLAKLQQIAMREEEEQKNANDNAQRSENEDDFDDDDDDDGVFLSTDMYLQSSQQIMPDGSLPDSFLDLSQSREQPRNKQQPQLSQAQIIQTITQPPPNSPYSSSSSGKELTLQDLTEAANNLSPPSLESQEELHRQVFENEKAFLEQSKLFREGLSDAEKASEAQAKRRIEQFQKEQVKEIKELEKALEEWQVMLDEKQQQQEKEQQERLQQAPKGEQPKQQQNDDDESVRLPSIDPSSTLSSEGEETVAKWVQVDDPSTGDSFYWNEETGEMRWDDLV